MNRIVTSSDQGATWSPLPGVEALNNVDMTAFLRDALTMTTVTSLDGPNPHALVLESVATNGERLLMTWVPEFTPLDAAQVSSGLAT